MKRLFLALWPDRETRQAINVVIDCLQTTGFKLIDAGNLHVTLVFLGQVDAVTEAKLRQQIDEVNGQSFSFIFDALSYWRKPGILSLTGRQELPSPLRNLAAELDALAGDCGLATDKRVYTPHITVARKARFKPEIEIPAIVWRADNFSLVESVSTERGVQYRVLATWSLNT